MSIRFLFLILLLLAASAKAAPFAEVMDMKGLASLEPKHTNLKVGMALSEGDRITVMSNSLLKLKFAGGSAAQIGAHSEVTLKRSEEKAPSLRLAHGMVLAVVREPEPADPMKRNRFEVRAGELSLAVYGGDFFVRSEGDNAAFVCTCSGAVKARWGKNQALLHGKGHDHPVTIRTFETKPQAAKEKGSDHADEDIAALKNFL